VNRVPRLIFFFVTLAALAPQATAANQPVASITGKTDGKLLFVQVTVNGAGPLWFCVDTGASHTVIDPSVVQQTGLKKVGAGTTTGTGTGAVQIERTEPATVKLGKIEVQIAEPWVIDLSNVPIPRWTHGLVGFEFFQAFVVEMDQEHARLRFFDPATYVAPRGVAAVPLIVEDRKLFVAATLEANEREKAERKLRVDTGSEESVADELVKKGAEVRSNTLGQGLGENYQGVSGLLKAVHFGPFTWTHVWGPEAPRPAIGMEIFRRFVATFDAAHGKLYLEPNRHIGEPIPEPAR
jgi:predicted aspartyl protease